MTPETANRIDGRVVLVTGASRGIGQATADWLKNMGGDVFGTATSPNGAERISERLGEGRGLVLDVTDSDAINETVATIKERAGAVTVLVNNAAITRDQLLMRLKDDDWDAVLDTNLRGAMRMTRACLRGMLKEKSGRIIGISSVVGYSGNPGQSNYAAAKAGLAGFSRSVAHELGSRGITANVVAPGFIETDMTAELDEKQRERLTDSIPLNRLGAVEDVAAAVGFLASDAGGYLTGQTLHVNGGMYMT
ncbi:MULTISPECIES: 3-oxoacyl-ACP reductase FabG [unclassified Wenzhouxiangella]|uniref:3-oxoacyl-ACP reductase FabG n=1 Tax=unclassified Wenzhouxiangella TaxID=2613841 RepID=UPI000E32859C|nr:MULTISPECIES: 3-oxoacyl-ACP reductase FabG [unclassified Wenzhouxiangella]RFF27949.1 3-oxoacyl-ACP reductase FabG [Wenzhouxiangella sp. 15181]RFP68536.1 3-oxoacyl-ACP reductase FabG [Wenzhouxiangella sp. 15190]